MNIRKFIQNKKGEVFILLALVILLYLMLLSTTIYNVTQIPYIEPSPEQDQTNNYIENAISALYDLVDVALNEYSHGSEETTVRANFIDNVKIIENYLDECNLVATFSVNETSFSITNSSMSANPVYISFKCSVSISIISINERFEATLAINVSYYVEISELLGNENYIYCYSIKQGIEYPLSDCQVTISPATTVTNIGDGSYMADLQTGQLIKVVFNSNILLWKEV
ncbi:MAG: hypothetical protein ACTSVB_09935 [Candidatus Heimdallarchaeaceae archaeon]